MGKNCIGNERKADMGGALRGKPSDKNPVREAGGIASKLKVGGLPAGMKMPKGGRKQP